MDSDRKIRIGRFALGASAMLSIALLVGRVSGLLRDLELAAAFGLSRQADVAVLLLALPDLLVGLLLANGLSGAIVPRLRQLEPEAAAALFRQVTLWVTAVFGLAGVIFVVWPTGVFGLLAPGLARPTELLVRGELPLVAISIPLAALSGVSMAYLNASSRFFIAGCGTLIFNLCVIAALAFRGPEYDLLTLLAVGIAAGAIVRGVLQYLVLPPIVWRSPALGPLVDLEFVKQFAAGMLAGALTLMPAVIIRAIASTIGIGAIASFSYAQKIIELPISIVLGPIFTVALTRLSTLHAAGRTADAQHEAHADIRRMMLMAIAALLVGLAFVDAFVDLVFGRGAMDAAAVERVTSLTLIALFGVPFYPVSSIATANLNAMTRSPVVFRITGMTLALVPLFAIPGIVLNSERWLMGAVVAFQFVVAVWLARPAGLHFWGEAGIWSRKMVRATAVGVVVAGVAVAVDRMTGFDSNLVRLLLGGTGFVLAVAASMRVLK